MVRIATISRGHEYSSTRLASYRRSLVLLPLLLVLFTFLSTPAPGQCPIPPGHMDIEPGMAVATYFSCLDPDRIVVAVYDTRDPLTNAPGLDQNWTPPRYAGPGAILGPDSWTADNLGEVFGVTLDDAVPPSIYVSATQIYPNGCAGIAAGPAGPGGVYRLDGITGLKCEVISLPAAAGAGLGQIDHVTISADSEMLYVSNLDDGLIYAVVPGCPGSTFSTFDHGVDGRPQENLAALPDDPTVGMTQVGRRIWGLRFNEVENRLYYAVWNIEADSTTNIPSDPNIDNEIWSVAIEPSTGGFVAGSARFEFGVPEIVGLSHTGEYPVADIAFECGTRMVIAQRGVYLTGQMNTLAHQSAVLEYTGSHLSWSASALDKFNVGTISGTIGANCAGGVDFDADGNVMASGDALHIATNDYLYGFTIMPSTGAGTVSPFTSNCYLIDEDCDLANQDKSYPFDVECCRPISTNCASTCAVENPTILCGSATSSDEFTVTFDVVNNSGFDVTKLVIPGLVGGVSVSPNIIDLAVPLPNGDTLTGVQIFLNGGIAGDIVCIPVGLLAKDDDGNLFECCGTEVCVELPACCMDISEESITIDAANGDAEYTFTVTNLGGFVAGHLFMNVISPPGATISNEWHDLGTLNVGGQITLSTIISGAQPGDEICFQITMHDATLNECCGIVHCITIPGGGTEPCVLVEGCTLGEDFDSDGVLDVEIFWNPAKAAVCCLEMTVFLDGVKYMSVDPNAGSAQILSSIDNLGSMSGTWCLHCFDPAVGEFVEQGCCVIPFAPPPPEFLRGDANSDGAFDISDVISSLDYLFQGQSVPCLVALDSNDDETVDIGDTIYSLEALFGGGPSPWPPYQQCGVDETSGNLGCEYFPACEGNDNGPQGG